MIVFFVGTPGSGKTYEAVKKIIDNLRLGRVVCTNIDGMDQPKQQEYIKALLDLDDYTFSQLFRFLSPAEVTSFWKTKEVKTTRYLPNDETEVVTKQELICPSGSLIVLDEVHKYFNCRSWNDKAKGEVNIQMADWASTHRHQGYDLVLITQDIEKVEKQVRSLTEWCYFFRKVNFLGSKVQKKYLCYAYSGDDHRGKPLSKSARTYQQKYFPCYQSYSNADAKEVGFMTHVNVLKHPIFFAIPIVIAFTVWMASKSSLASGDLFGTSKRMKAASKKIEDDRKKQQQNPVAVPGQPSLSVQSQTSSARISALASPLPPGSAAPGGTPLSSPPSWYTYDVQGIIRNGAQTVYLVQGRMFRQHECRNYNPSARVVECFGPQLSYTPPSHSSVKAESLDEKKQDAFYQPTDVVQVNEHEKIDGEWVLMRKTFKRTPDGFKLINSEPDKG